ncbi:MAG: ABC transporter permease [Gammaproteobacteria bacterium]|nr:ABC transporter permease [Gammaproteobacteria bacterium]
MTTRAQAMLANSWNSIGITWKLLRRNRAGFIGFWAVVFFLLLAYVGPLVLPVNMTENVAQIYQPPSWHHLLGTDNEGRDILSEIVLGGGGLIGVSFLAAAISTFISITFGALAAFVGGRTDYVILGITDIILTIPQFPLLAVLAGFVRLSNGAELAALLGLLSWPTLLRAVRAEVLSLREQDFVQSARGLDLGTTHIIFREILPNMFTYIAINFIIGMTGAMYAQVALIFLGMVPLAQANWGVMLSLAWTQGAAFYSGSLSYILSPVIAIALFQLALITFNRSLEEIFNPRLRTEG